MVAHTCTTHPQSVQEVEQTLNEIQADHVDGKLHSYKVVYVGGDQQLYDRMITLKEEQSEKYAWLIPIAGEFHFTAHAVDAVHRMYWNPLVSWCVEKLGFNKVVKANEDNITHYKHYDWFYQLLTRAVLKVVCDAIPLELLLQPQLLLEQCEDNKGT